MKNSIFAAFLIFSSGLAFASGDSHPGNNPLIVGGSFGLVFAFFSWLTADHFTRTPEGNYNAAKWISGLILGVIFLLCLVVLFGENSESGLKTFVVIGYFFFALPNVALIYLSRKSALEFELAEKLKNEQDLQRATQEKSAKEQIVASPDQKRPARPSRTNSSEPGRKKESAQKNVSGSEDEKTVQEVAVRGTRRRTAVELGVICTSLRYDEHEHGKQLSRLFDKAREEWVKSRNETASPHYAKACKLLTEWFTVQYRVSMGFSLSFGLNEDNEIDKVTKVGELKDSSEHAAQAFAEEPRLKSFEVVRVDFRAHTSHHPLQEQEKLCFSPEIGAVAVYQVKPVQKLGSPQKLEDFLASPAGGQIASCFSVQVKDAAIETVELDEAGDEYTSVSSSYSGGEVELEVNLSSAKDFRDILARKVREAHETPSLLSDGIAEPKRLLMLADEQGLRRLLDEGLDVDTELEDETLLQLALMLATTSSTFYDHADLSETLKSRFSSAQEYGAAIKRIALDLLNRGADVNMASGEMKVLTLAELLKDPAILEICRARSSSVDDANSMPLLFAAERGDVASLKTLLDRGARVNKRYLVTGVTPLMMACQGSGGEDAPPLTGDQLANHEAAVRLLIERGARVDARAENGDTAIGNAVRRGNASIIRILLEAGANTKEALPKGQDLMDLAKDRGHKEVIEILRSVPGDVLAKGKVKRGMSSIQ